MQRCKPKDDRIRDMRAHSRHTQKHNHKTQGDYRDPPPESDNDPQTSNRDIDAQNADRGDNDPKADNRDTPQAATNGSATATLRNTEARSRHILPKMFATLAPRTATHSDATPPEHRSRCARRRSRHHLGSQAPHTTTTTRHGNDRNTPEDDRGAPENDHDEEECCEMQTAHGDNHGDYRDTPWAHGSATRERTTAANRARAAPQQKTNTRKRGRLTEPPPRHTEHASRHARSLSRHPHRVARCTQTRARRAQQQTGHLERTAIHPNAVAIPKHATPTRR